METRKEVIPVEVDFICPVCKKCSMRPTGSTLLIYPAKYKHNCEGCGYEDAYLFTYPYIEYKDKRDGNKLNC